METPDPLTASNPGLAPMRNPAFRLLWLTSLAANMTMWMHDMTAAWLMATLTHNITLIALVQAASTLPVFLLGLPSGALADIVDRRAYFALTQLWMAAVAAVLATMSFAGMLTAPLLLLLTFASGIGSAMRFPVVAAIVPELVSQRDLPQALALNSVVQNISRVAGPAIAGILLSSFSSTAVFTVNVVLAVVAFWMVLRLRPPKRVSVLPGERFVGAIGVGLRHMMQSSRMRIVLLRSFLFFTQSIALIALLPVIARDVYAGDARTFTMLLAAMGCGAIMVAFVLSALRARFSADFLVRAGIFGHAVMSVAVVLAPNLLTALLAAGAAGMATMVAANALNVAAQTALPNWVRARGMSIFQMSVMGGNAIGAALWGVVAGHVGVRESIFVAAVYGPVCLLLTWRLSVRETGGDDVRRVSLPNTAPAPWEEPGDDAGSLMVTIEYLIEPCRADEFKATMRNTRSARLRQGVLSWGLFRDSATPGRYIECYVDRAWVEHLRRQERHTAADAELRDLRHEFHVGLTAPHVHRYLAEL